jgi:hypothetical protein
MDLYHCQIVEGDVAMKIRKYLPTGRVGHIQIAGVPERHEPDIGEQNYGYLFDVIDEVSAQSGWQGWVGCEYRPRAARSPAAPPRAWAGCAPAIVPSASQTQARGTLLSALVEAHAHIDKNYTVQEVGAAQGNLFAAIERMEKHRAGWTGETLRPRMERALHDAWQSGTRALRTHIDWVQPEPPAALAVFEALREEWRGRIELQFVSLTPLDVFADLAAGERIAAK